MHHRFLERGSSAGVAWKGQSEAGRTLLAPSAMPRTQHFGTWELAAGERMGGTLLILSSQPRDSAGNSASNLCRRLQLPVSQADCTPLFLILSPRALHRGRLKRALSSWAPCPQRKKGRRCLKYWQSGLFALRKRGNVSSGTALEMEASFPCKDQQNKWVPQNQMVLAVFQS